MKPAAQLLIAAGVALALGATAFASLVVPVREATQRSGNQHAIVRQNLWGQPRWGIFTDWDRTNGRTVMESGPFQRGQRHGRWNRHETVGDQSTHADVWYLDGKAVTEAEWNRGR